MAGPASSNWKSSLQIPESLDTKTFTWRIRANLTQPTSHVEASSSSNTASRSAKNTNVAGVSTRLLANTMTNTAAAAPSSSQSMLTTIATQDQNQQQFLRFQEFEIEAGQSLGLHSMWSLFLVSCGSSNTAQNQRSNTNIQPANPAPGTSSGTSTSQSSSPAPTSANSDFVGIFLRKILKAGGTNRTGYSTKNDEIVVRYKLEIMDREGEVLYTKECESKPRDKLETGYWDWSKILPLWKFQNSSTKGKGSEQAGSGEECLLLMRLTFSLVNRRKRAGTGRVLTPNPGEEESASHEQVSVREAANSFLSLVSNSNSLQPDVVIDITNRRKFFVHKKVLIGRSPVFKKLLGQQLNEKTGGATALKIDDISANTMELVLKHIYTGQLEEEWTTNPVTVTELIYASEKYWLPALKEFCNKHLVRAATKNNCYRLMEVAQLHNLEQAAEDLMSYVSEGISSNSNSRKPSEESVEIQS